MTAQRLDTKPVLDKFEVSHRAGQDLGDAVDVPKRARQFVRDRLEQWAVSGDCIDTVLLLTSEVVTNALCHAGPPLHLALTHGSFGVNVDVSDSSLMPPVVSRPDFDHEGGRGLWLVETLATTWGTTLTEERKSVWFTLETASERSGRASSDGYIGVPPVTARTSPVT
jgi:two-component sensor histidine kinase